MLPTWTEVNTEFNGGHLSIVSSQILKEGNSSTTSLGYMALVCPILEYGAVCWDPYREGQIHLLDRVQKKAD
jgi:hypothetical protein